MNLAIPLAQEVKFPERAIIDALGDAIFVLDAQTIICDTNAAAQSLLELDRDKLLGRLFEEVVAEADIISLIGVEAALGSSEKCDLNILLKKSDESCLPVSATSSRVLLGDSEQGYILLCRDSGGFQELVSEQNRRAVAETERADHEAEARNAAEKREQEQIDKAHHRKLESIGQLSEGIAHELNTPIQFVGDNFEFMQTSFDRLLSGFEAVQKLIEGSKSTGGIPVSEIQAIVAEAKIDYLSKEVPLALAETRAGVKTIAKIVAAMKDFTNSSQSVRQLTDLRKLIESTATVAKSEWSQVATLELRFAEDLPEVLCFADEFKQVVLNMLTNAAQAIAEANGVSKGSLGKIVIGAQVSGDLAVITISDTGIGIEAVNIEKIFDPFFTTRDVGKGTGQGLSIAYNVVDSHGGKILVDSEIGKGTTFVIQLPLNGIEVAESATADQTVG